MLKAASSFIFETRSVLLGNRGQSLVEYTLVLSFVSLLTVVLMTVLDVQMRSLYSGLVNALALVRAVI